jgi:HK97 family phage major capsid protein
LEDVPQVREYIDNRGTFQIQLAEESALLNFTVGANKWDGFLQKSGVQTQASGADPTPTAVLKAMTKVQYSPGFAAMATGIAMNPTDWQNVLTLQETTGAYIWSAPSAPTAMPDMRMWGMTVRPVSALTQGTALLGNFQMFSQIWRRSGLSIRLAYANDDALLNLVRIIFEERLCLVISRAAAFAKVTGLPA